MDLYHVLNRGVDKRAVVLDDSDRARFIHNLFAFNDADIVQHISQPQRQHETLKTPRKLLVRIHAFCLMDNHYHLLISEVVENGISLFMQKLNMGYSKYFNERYDRVGALWQGKHKRILIERDGHYAYIPYYIHLNPLDYSMPEWRAGEVKNTEKALQILQEYRWSSHIDYLSEKNFPSISYRDLLSGALGSRRSYEKELCSIMTNSSRSASAEDIEN